MKSISVFCTFFAFCVALTSAGVISDREDAARENLRKLALDNNEMAFNLHRRLVSGSSENVFFSPLSISTAFGMLFYGARGETAEELRETLGYERADLPNYLVHDTFNRYLREGTWKTKFEPEKTRYEFFYNNGLESEGRRVPLMHLTSRFAYASVDNFQALELPYKGENVSMLILLPNERDGLQDLEESLTPERLDEVQRRLYRTKVDVSLPKFKLQFEKELSPDVQALGANQIFRNGADFSGMTSSRNAAVSQVVHKAVIEVNEDGSEAAAVTGISVVFISEILETPHFRADHPFLFAIVEKGSNTISEPHLPPKKPTASDRPSSLLRGNLQTVRKRIARCERFKVERLESRRNYFHDELIENHGKGAKAARTVNHHLSLANGGGVALECALVSRFDFASSEKVLEEQRTTLKYVPM
ncbi:Serpin B4 [Araneus ventricosus]|uniref:Serpin B4 n=1 Tax=Araneus ventricosus TaxID=182803 RepID=A0A4Y2DPS4_ARAVE|nr:Serpin B4 [Araneus ventricosus]